MTDIKNVPLSLPLTGALIGTVATLFVGKKWHAGFGILWSLLSLWHGLQHAGKMQKDAAHLWPPAKTTDTTKLQNFVAGLKIAAFTPGRLRVYHAALIGNEDLARQLEEYLASFTGVKKATVGTLTGSLLIEYDTERLRTKKGLAALEKKIMVIYGKDKQNR